MKPFYDLDIFKVFHALAYPLQPYRGYKCLAANSRAGINQPAFTRRSGLAIFDVGHVVPRIVRGPNSPGVHRPVEQSRGAGALVQETKNAVVDGSKVDLPFRRERVLNDSRVRPDAVSSFQGGGNIRGIRQKLLGKQDPDIRHGMAGAVIT